MQEIANVEMAAAWDGDEGDDWAADWQRYDRAVAHHHGCLMAAAGVGVGDRVLDIGCGNGQTTRDAARAATAGSALGVDLSSRMIERARELAAGEDVGNVTFEQVDAQVHPFEPGAFDLAISRYGAMFFADRDAAFTNIARALRPGGRLAVVTWQEVGENEWLVEIRRALSAGRELAVPPAGIPGPFGLADRDGVRSMLLACGFAGVEIDAVDAPFWVGENGADAFAFMSSSGVARGLLGGLDDDTKQRGLDALRATMDAHESRDGVVFDSRSWLITAGRA